MEVRKKLKPGEHGTKRHARKYGDKLVCVRYRYNDEENTRYTTVEIIVDQQHYYHSKQAQKPNTSDRQHSTLVKLKVAYQDMETRTLIKNAGGIWNTKHKYWELDEALVIKLGLEKRMIRDA